MVLGGRFHEVALLALREKGCRSAWANWLCLAFVSDVLIWFVLVVLGVRALRAVDRRALRLWLGGGGGVRGRSLGGLAI